MANRADYLKVARQLKGELNGKAFLSKPRIEITELIREASGEDSFRLKSNAASELEYELLNQGVRVYPSLKGTTTGNVVRLFHIGTVIASLIDLLVHPDEETDKQLADITKKVKGEWDWSVHSSPT